MALRKILAHDSLFRLFTTTRYTVRGYNIRCIHARTFSSVLNNNNKDGYSRNLFSTPRVALSSSSRGTILQSDGIIKSPLRDVAIPESAFLPHYVMEHWHKYTNRTAMINSETGAQLTFGELQTQIVKTGSALVRLGFTKGDVVTLFSPNCPEFCIVYMAAASIGMTVSAVNPVYTPGELVHALTMSESKLLVLAPSLIDVVTAALHQCPTVKKTLCLGSADGLQPLSSLLEDDGKAFPDNIDYDAKDDVVLLPYSSGTTGLPKGVMLTSYNMIANLEQIGTEELLNPSSNDFYICVLPLFHLFAQFFNLLFSFRHGITNVIMGKFEPVTFLDNIQKYKPTHLQVVPPIMLFLAKHPIVDRYDFSSVTSYLYAAAPMAANIVEDVQQRIARDALLMQAYGMTEMSPVSHMNPRDHCKPTTCGVAVHNTDFLIRDMESDKSLPAHKEGEVCVRGPQVMKGYFKNEKATNETIIDNWIHTGDIGYYDDEGYLTITDRLKELIKYKGLQVAPAELEDLLLKHPSVQDAAVIGKPDDAAGELPRAYIVLKPDCKTTEEEIQNFVKENAAPYKQLRGGVELRNEIPKSASGKILRRYLRDELRQQSTKS